MLTVTSIGRVTADLEPKKSEKTGNEYLRFGLAVNKGYSDNQRTVFLQCMLYGEQQAQRMINAKVQKEVDGHGKEFRQQVYGNGGDGRDR